MPATDTIRIDCPHCGKRLRGKPGMAGKRIRCPNPACGQTIAVPAEPAPDAAAPAARPLWPWLVGGGLGCLVLVGLGVGLVVLLVSAVLVSNDSTKGPIAKGPPEKKTENIPPPVVTPVPTKDEKGADKKPVGGADGAVASKDKGGEKKTDGATDLKKPPEPPTVFFRLPIDAVASQERLDKLKVVRLDAKVSFSVATNVNDITLMWCWEPNITVRFEERFQQDQLDKILQVAKLLNKNVGDLLRPELAKVKGQMKMDAETGRGFDREVDAVLATGNYKALLDSTLLIDTNDAHMLFNNRLPIRLQGEQAAKMRNLCYALSLSNLVPLQKHAFEVKEGADTTVRGKPCRLFTVRDTQGTELELCFDKATDLLAKISHQGRDPRVQGDINTTARWEHYFSDYRESDGIKQWRRLECHVNGASFATLTVSGVQYFDRLLPELQLPKAGS